MNNKTRLTRYVDFKRREGLPDEAIRESLGKRGWSAIALNSAFDSSMVKPNNLDISNDIIVARPLFVQTPVTSKSIINRKLVVTLVVLVAVSSGALFVSKLLPKTNSPTINTVVSNVVNDSNYKLALPAGWKATSDYSNGAGVNVFAPAQTDPSLGKSRMTVFVLPQQAGESFATRINQQLRGLSQNAGQVETLSTEKISFAGEKGEIRQISSAPSSDPNAITYHVFAGVVYGKTIYNIDVSVPAYQWPSSKVSILNSVKSFTPKNQSVTTKPRP